ncbi:MULTISPECIES: TOPRIM nucleotidyl transferase/hydrolase domain-containing protein [unclassified Nocardioides]|uniref:TOPRIM nucleotidyl transferase/hydrolase domain-containing protein n=1 Tax=unclassified Nocardioides TaxID=2615069 RepID=UPI0006F52B86|nr:MULTISPECIES: TOPRIM nucleotidyl transferase/hydrolase domain-containing protein [unclassified Nocardioides]KQY64297.1 hypothetical protein ASD30_04960 [Nocardioides sp. Root140]KRF16313.1 hypothetical protein ASH02_06985 [Nocardioides sp. Soil796]
MTSTSEARAVVLVEGDSDRNAVLTLAERLGRDLLAERVEVVAMGGATNIGHALEEYGPGGRDLELHGLYDEGEERFFRRGLERVGLGADLDRAQLAELGFHCCVVDLEDELVRALGVPAVEAIIESEGEARSWGRFLSQPDRAGRPMQDQLRRFMGTRSGRKIRYGGLLVAALDLDRVPDPLADLLEGLA